MSESSGPHLRDYRSGRDGCLADGNYRIKDRNYIQYIHRVPWASFLFLSILSLLFHLSLRTRQDARSPLVTCRGSIAQKIGCMGLLGQISRPGSVGEFLDTVLDVRWETWVGKSPRDAVGCT